MEEKKEVFGSEKMRQDWEALNKGCLQECDGEPIHAPPIKPYIPNSTYQMNGWRNCEKSSFRSLSVLYPKA